MVTTSSKTTVCLEGGQGLNLFFGATRGLHAKPKYLVRHPGESEGGCEDQFACTHANMIFKGKQGRIWAKIE